jgi:RNA polymerase sigma factor (sigma-70 family)
MVLSASVADPGAARARAWLDKLIQPLELSRGGILLCLRDATPTQLGPVVRALSSAPPWGDEDAQMVEVCLRAPDVLDVAPGSRVLLRVRVEDLDWLNIARPLFAERELRTILWADAQAFDGLIRRAVDFFDWVSRVVAVPSKAVPDFAVVGMRSALAAGDEIAWRGAGLRETLDAAGAGATIELHVEEPYLELIARLRDRGLPIVSGVGSQRDAWRVRLALALAGREGSWVALDPGASIDGMRSLHAQQSDWDEASAKLAAAGWSRAALVAAWLDLEPERIMAARDHVGVPPPLMPVMALSRSEDLKEGRLLRAIGDHEGETPSVELIAQAEDIGFPEVAMSLSFVRWQLEEEDRTEQLVEWLVNEGETQIARRVVQRWRERAATSSDSTSLTATDHWLAVIQSIDALEARVHQLRAGDASDVSDVELLERWRAGDKRAASSLVARHHNPLRRYFFISVPEDVALDLVQETFERLTRVATSTSEVVNVRALLFTIARRVLLDHYRSNYRARQRFSPFSEDVHGTEQNPEGEFAKSAQDRDLLACLQKLPLDARSLIALHYWQGLNLAELAEIFDVQPSTLRSRLFSARKQLAACLGDADLDTELRAARARLDPKPSR